jgi:hypothetical protein
MQCTALNVGMRVRHPAHGLGIVKAITEHSADVQFDDQRRTVEPVSSGLEPAEPQAAITGLSVPLAVVVRQAVDALADRLGLMAPDAVVQELAARWRGGRLVLHPTDPTLTTKEVELEQFFHKIVMVRNNLRLLEQKVNASDALSSAEKFDCQQYITRCYGSLTTFNVLFKDKESQFTGSKS